MLTKSLLSLFILLLLPHSALAIPAITCHCFTDRSFDPARPAVADPYFLATTQNTFFSIVFGLDKKSIVLMKQKGTPADDLWIAYRVAELSDRTPETLLLARASKASWSEVLAPLRLSPQASKKNLSSAITSRASDARLAQSVVDDLFISFRLLSAGELATLRKSGITNQQLILAALISAKTGQPVERIYREVTSGGKSWGEKIVEGKLDINELEAGISALLKVFKIGRPTEKKSGTSN